MEGELQFVIGARSSHRYGDNDEMVDVHGNDRGCGLKISYIRLIFLICNFNVVFVSPKTLPQHRRIQTQFWTPRERISEIPFFNTTETIEKIGLFLLFSVKNSS